MTRRALVTALATTALAGCATARSGAGLTLETGPADRLPAVQEPVVSEPLPSSLPMPPPPHDPMTAGRLRARLIAFVLDAEATRESTAPGSAIPEVELRAWGRAQADLDRFFLEPPAPDEGEHVQVVRDSLRAALEQDGRAYDHLPPELVAAVEARLSQLETRAGSTGSPRFQWPLPDVRVTSRFGRRFHPIAHRNKMHSGIDMVAERNQPVVAAGAGTVVRAGWMHGYGYEVTVDHGDGRMTRYSHLARTLVHEGTRVARGMPLGLAGRTGTATGVHLHFEYWKNEVALDPLREFVRLVGEDGPKPTVMAPNRSVRRVRLAARKPEGPGA
jgi:murein DD-endopeptidase MepM/ murein hydrolase activator NlpD